MGTRRRVALVAPLAVTAVLMLAAPPAARGQSNEGGLPAVAARVTTLEGVVATQQTSLTAIQSAVASVQNSVSVLQTGLATVQGNVTTLQTAITALQASVSALQGSVTALQNANTTILNSVNALGARVTSIEEKGGGTGVLFVSGYKVPAGKRLRIDTVSGRALGNPGADGLWTVTMNLSPAPPFGEINFVPLVERNSRGEQWRFHQNTHITLEPNTEISFSDQCIQCPQGRLVTGTGVLFDAD